MRWRQTRWCQAKQHVRMCYASTAAASAHVSTTNEHRAACPTITALIKLPIIISADHTAARAAVVWMCREPTVRLQLWLTS